MANSANMKITEVIDKQIYPIVQGTLSKSTTKWKALMSKFMNARATSLYDTFPATRCTYGQQDADELYAIFGKTERELQEIINKTYYAQIPNFNPRTAKNPVTVLGICIIKYFLSKNDKANLEVAIIYLSFSGGFYPSIHYGSYPTAVPADYRFVCDYVVNNELSNKFDLKKTGSVVGTIKSIGSTWIEAYRDKFKGVTDDEEYVYVIQQLHMRIKSFIQNTAEIYYKCYQNREYLTYDSDDMSEDNFRLTENDSTKIEAVTNRAMTWLTTHDVDFRLCKMCSDANVKTEEIKSIIESIVKNTDNIDLVKELVALIVTNYFKSSKNKDVRDIEFISYSIKAKPNTKDKDVLRQNEIVDKFLCENSIAYNRRKSREATKNSYNRAVLTYFVLVINQSNK
ncbi:MAG: hypothetical protein VZR64_00185 [Eubacterium sp.]|nr:hypothetical protein [Eubacterium sp.]